MNKRYSIKDLSMGPWTTGRANPIQHHVPRWQLFSTIFLAASISIGLLSSCSEKAEAKKAEAVKTETDWLKNVDSDPFLFVDVSMWILGRDLSLLGLGCANGVDVADTRNRCARICETLGKPLPPLRDQFGSDLTVGDETLRNAKALNYAMTVVPDALGSRIRARHGDKAIAAFELGIKSALVPLVYFPEDSGMRTSLASAIKRAATDAGLPDPTWKPLWQSISDGAPRADVLAHLKESRTAMNEYWEALSPVHGP